MIAIDVFDRKALVPGKPELDSTRSSSCRTACSFEASVSTVLEEYVEVLDGMASLTR